MNASLMRNKPDVRDWLLDHNGIFWAASHRCTSLLKSVATAIACVEGDDAPLSVMCHGWAHVTSHLNAQLLLSWGFTSDDGNVIVMHIANVK